MSLEQAFKRLALRPSSVCHECRRSFASSAQRRQQQSATTHLLDSVTNSQKPTTSVPAAQTSSDRGYKLAEQAILESTASRTEAKRARDLADLNRQYSKADLERQISRRWRPGDVYAPHDLSGVEMAKWKKLRRKPKPKFDVLDQLGINPLHHYKNFSIMSEYITPMGRIRHSNETGLRPVNQRRMAKAIRRAMGMGLMPGVHRHPEIIKSEETSRNRPH